MKNQFPLFTHHPHLVYLDNAATVQKPAYVLDEVTHFLTHTHANIHRGTYPLALAAEEQRDRARHTVAEAIGAKDEEVIFTSNATFGSNLLALSFVQSGWIQEGDIILVGVFDHHANITPRQLVAERTGAVLVYVGFDRESWQYDWSVFSTLDINRVKVVSLSAVSNVTGQIFDLSVVKELSKICEMYLVIDASQLVPHVHLDVISLGADFVYFTGHKLGALTGSGVLRGKKEHLARLSPPFVGGGAVDQVSLYSHTYQPAPDKFEPGTPNVVGAVSLRAAFAWIASCGGQVSGGFADQLHAGYAVLSAREQQQIAYCVDSFSNLQERGHVQMVGSLDNKDRIGLFSRSVTSGNIHKLGHSLGEQYICIRTGTHCTHPFHAELGLASTARMSLRAYNDLSDLERFFSALRDGILINK